MKGILFTAMLASIAMVILTLATTYLVYTSKTNAALDKTIVFYSMTEEFNTIERMTADVLALHNYSFDVEDNNATVRYYFPATEPEIRNSLDDNVSFLWFFVENISDFDTKVDLSYLNGSDTMRGNLSLRFFPDSATLDSVGGIGSDEIEIRNAGNITAYEAYIYTDSPGFWQVYPDPCNCDTGDTWPVMLRVSGNTESGNELTGSWTQLKGDGTSSLNMTLGGPGATDWVAFNVSEIDGDKRTLSVYRHGNFNVYMDLNITFNTTEMMQVLLNKETINMTVSQYYIRKSGNIRVG